MANLKTLLGRCFSRSAALNVGIALLYAMLVPIICLMASMLLGRCVADWQFASAFAPYENDIPYPKTALGQALVVGALGPLVGLLTGMAMARRSGAWLPAVLVAYTFAKFATASSMVADRWHSKLAEEASNGHDRVWAAYAFSDLATRATMVSAAIAVVTGVIAVFLGHYLVNKRWPRPDPKQSDEPADELDALDETN